MRILSWFQMAGRLCRSHEWMVWECTRMHSILVLPSLLHKSATSMSSSPRRTPLLRTRARQGEFYMSFFSSARWLRLRQAHNLCFCSRYRFPVECVPQRLWFSPRKPEEWSRALQCRVTRTVGYRYPHCRCSWQCPSLTRNLHGYITILPYHHLGGLQSFFFCGITVALYTCNNFE